MPRRGGTLVFCFHVPGSEREVVTDGVVAWTNPQQEHPVHSLPPGFGVAFRAPSPEVRERNGAGAARAVPGGVEADPHRSGLHARTRRRGRRTPMPGHGLATVVDRGQVVVVGPT